VNAQTLDICEVSVTTFSDEYGPPGGLLVNGSLRPLQTS
jgi:hypothetical protein